MIELGLVGRETLALRPSSASSPDSSASGISASIRSQPVQPSRGPMPSIWPRRPATAEVIRLVALDGQTTRQLVHRLEQVRLRGGERLLHRDAPGKPERELGLNRRCDSCRRPA